MEAWNPRKGGRTAHSSAPEAEGEGLVRPGPSAGTHAPARRHCRLRGGESGKLHAFIGTGKEYQVLVRVRARSPTRHEDQMGAGNRNRSLLKDTRASLPLQPINSRFPARGCARLRVIVADRSRAGKQRPVPRARTHAPSRHCRRRGVIQGPERGRIRLRVTTAERRGAGMENQPPDWI